MAYRADEVKVGIVIVAFLVILAGFIIAILGLTLTEKNTYTTTMSFVGGIDPGKEVRFGGMKVGTVSELSVSKKNNSLIEITMDIDEGVPIKKDSVASVDTNGFIGDFYVEISTGAPGSPLLPPGSEIPSREVVSFNQILADAKSAVDKLNTTLVIVNEKILAQEFPKVRDEVMKIADKLSKLLTDTDQVITENRQNIAKTIEQLRLLVQTTASDEREIGANFRAASKKLESLADSLDSFVNENRDKLGLAIDDFRSMAAEARSAADSINRLVEENSNSVTLAIDNLDATMSNAREFSEEIARQPWRLIWRTREPEKQLFKQEETANAP